MKYWHFTYWQNDYAILKFDFAAQLTFLPDVTSFFVGWSRYTKSARRRRVFSPAPVSNLWKQERSTTLFPRPQPRPLSHTPAAQPTFITRSGTSCTKIALCLVEQPFSHQSFVLFGQSLSPRRVIHLELRWRWLDRLLKTWQMAKQRRQLLLWADFGSPKLSLDALMASYEL